MVAGPFAALPVKGGGRLMRCFPHLLQPHDVRSSLADGQRHLARHPVTCFERMQDVIPFLLRKPTDWRSKIL